MSSVAQRLPRRPVSGAGRKQFLLTWKLLVPALVLATAAIAIPFLMNRGPRLEPVAYTELTSAMDAGRVASLTIEPGRRITGDWTGASAPATSPDFSTVYPLSDADALLLRAEEARVPVSFTTMGAQLQTVLTIALEILLIGGLCYLLFIQLRGGSGANGELGKSVHGEETRFDDVAGTQGAAEELHEIVDFLKQPAAFGDMGARVPRGVLLVGPPGTGKTLLARAVAGEANVPFFQISGSEVTGFVVGLGAHRIRSLFKKARKHGGVIFIDELDALGGIRGRNRSHNEDDRTLNQLLVEMDGFSPADGVVVVAATNRPDDLDKALKRPGRFDRIVTVGLPSSDGRAAILALHAAKRSIPLSDDVDLKRLARLTPGSSGAELANLLNEAAIAAVRTKADNVTWSHVEIARDRMLLGKERVGFRAKAGEWRTVAFHEAGHAIAGVIACPEDGLHKVTIQPRGQAMGVAHFAPEDDRHLHSRRYLEAQIVKGLGGRAAEELVFGADEVTGGAESDLVHVNRVARQMVYRLGMGASGGLLVHDGEAAPLSAQTQAQMDADVQALLERLYARTLALMSEHRAALDALAHALLERETLDGAEALALLAAHGVPVPEPTPAVFATA